MKKILYIDDNEFNLSIFSETFSKTFNITTSSNPNGVFNLLEGEKFDAIILDVHMPGKSGFDILNEITESRFSTIPVLMYTSDELQVVRYQALLSSACDIIYRTLDDREIELRILNKINLFNKDKTIEKHLTIGSLKLNTETLEAFHKDTNLELTPIEFKILMTLVKNFPEKISRENLMKKAWNQNNVLDRTVNTHLTNLRNKLPKLEFSIESPRGTGIVLKKVTTETKSSFIANALDSVFH